MLKSLLKFLSPKRIIHYINTHRKRSALLITIFLILLYLIIPKSQSTVLTQKVERKDVVKSVSVTGTIDADTTVNLTFQSPETLSWVGVKVGDSVTRGQAIASLDQTILQASLRQAQQDFTAAKATSQQYYDDHKNAFESDAEKVQRTAIDATQNKAYDQLLKVQYDITHSTLYSPIDGIVTRADAQTAGVNVNTLTTFTITNPSSLNFKMEVDEADIGTIAIGQPVQVSLDAFPDSTINLAVDSIDFVSHQTSSGGNAFYVKSHFSNSNNYRVGMGGNADIVLGEEKNALSIPTSSIFDDNYVYLLKNKKFEKTKVKLGLKSDTDAQVLSGLSEGDYVALDSTSVPQNQIIK